MQKRKTSKNPFLWLGLVAMLALCAISLSPTHASAAGVPYVGLTAMGMPASPQPWNPTDFAVAKHLRNSPTFSPPYDGGTAMQADHGADCAPPPAQHATNGNYAGMTFICHDHMMTAINSDDNGYGEIVFQPNQLVDFSNGGTAHVSISVSTNKPVNAARSWISFHFAPFNEQQSYLETIADGQANAADDLQVTNEFAQRLTFTAQESVNGADYTIPGSGVDVDSIVTPSATVRTPFDFYISQTHLRVAVAGVDLFNATLAHPLNYSQAVFQSITHSYTPDKENLPPVTWHWSDLTIDNAVPYFLAKGTPEAVSSASTITFSAPAPAGTHVRFQAYYDDTQISFDNGATWQRVNNVTGGYTWGDALNVWMPVPTGATSMRVRGNNGVGNGWYARDFYLMSLTTGSTPPTPTNTPVPPTPTAVPPTSTPVPPTPTPVPPTPTPTNTPVPPTPTPSPGPSPAPGPTPIPIDGVPCTVTINGVAQDGTCSGSFVPKAPSGPPAQLVGAALSTFEFGCGSHFGPSDFAAMVRWRINTVSLPISDALWAGTTHCPTYRQDVRQAILNANAAGLYVVLTEAWTNPYHALCAPSNNVAGAGYPLPARADMQAFWPSVASVFADRTRAQIGYQLYSEPHDVTPAQWRDGGTITTLAGTDRCAGTYTAAGMQEMVTLMNRVASGHILYVSGASWGGDLSFASSEPITGRDWMYDVHVWNSASTTKWDGQWGASIPSSRIVALEFGQTSADTLANCATADLSVEMAYIRAHASGMVAWAWDTGHCGRPPLLAAYDGTPSSYGQPIHDFYLGLP